VALPADRMGGLLLPPEQSVAPGPPKPAVALNGEGAPPFVATKRVRCGVCASCTLKDDCGQCHNCRDKPKYGGPGVKKQACVHRVCHHQVVCPTEAGDGKRQRCGQCLGCASTQDCGQCHNCRDKPKFGGPGVKKQACVHRVCRAERPKRPWQVAARGAEWRARHGLTALDPRHQPGPSPCETASPGSQSPVVAAADAAAAAAAIAQSAQAVVGVSMLPAAPSRGGSAGGGAGASVASMAGAAHSSLGGGASSSSGSASGPGSAPSAVSGTSSLDGSVPSSVDLEDEPQLPQAARDGGAAAALLALCSGFGESAPAPVPVAGGAGGSMMTGASSAGSEDQAAPELCPAKRRREEGAASAEGSTQPSPPMLSSGPGAAVLAPAPGNAGGATQMPTGQIPMPCVSAPPPFRGAEGSASAAAAAPPSAFCWPGCAPSSAPVLPADLPASAVQLVQTREEISELLDMHGKIDLIVPRGSNERSCEAEP